jgi:alpha-D-xyloside xylohydrolase
LQTKEEYDGNQWYQKHYNYFGLPLMVRENTILPVGAIDNDCEYDYEDNLTLEVYNLVENKEATRTVYSKDRKEAVKVSMLKQGDQIKVSLEATKSLAIRFINLKVKSEQLEVQDFERDSLVKIEEPKKVKEITFIV